MADIYTVYPIAKKLIPDGTIDLKNDTIKVALLNGYFYNAGHDYWDDVSANEVSMGGTYAAGGTALASKAVDLDAPDEEGYFDAADLEVGSGMAGTFQQIMVYKSTGTPGTSPLIMLIALETSRTLAGQTLQLVISADGIMRFL